MHRTGWQTRCSDWGLFALLAATLALAVAGCVSNEPAVPGGTELRRHHWWSYYERGAALMREGRAAEARPDFERCLGLRSGATYAYDRDTWRARTYGMHFLEDYFPNRELGVCLYEAGDPTGAVRHLERSLAQTPSGRAKHYLNLARRRLLQGAQVSAPVLRFEGGATPRWTRERRVRLAAVAAGEGYVRAVQVNGAPQFVELAAREVPVNVEVPLRPGTNAILVAAEDLAGQRIEQAAVWVADWQPPEFSLLRAERQGADWLLEGRWRDDAGLASVLADGAPVPGLAGERARAVRLRVPVGRTGLLSAEDLAGNRAQAVLDPAELGLAPGGDRAAAGEADAAAPAAAGPDRLRPTLRVSGRDGTVEVVRDEYFLDGTASDGGGIASVTLNGEELLGAGDAGGPLRHFARRVALDLGTNVFEVVAADRAGNRSAARRAVVYRKPECLEEEYRLRVGVPPFLPEERAAAGLQVKRTLEAELAREPVRFQLLERDEGWDLILREQGLSVSELADPAAALRIAKMIPAEMLFMGSLLFQGKGTTVFVKVVETGEGRVLLSEDVYAEGDDREFEYQIGGLVLKIEQRFPLASAAITAIEGGTVSLQAGSEQGLASGTRMVVLARGEGAPDDVLAWPVRRAEGRPVEVALSRVRSSAATGAVVPAAAGGLIQRGDYAFTR